MREIASNQVKIGHFQIFYENTALALSGKVRETASNQVKIRKFEMFYKTELTLLDMRTA